MPTVLVTGANRGIGLEFARQYAGDGWKALATARDLEKAGDLRTLSGDVSVFTMDAADDASIQQLARQLEGFTAVIVGINRRHKIHAGLRISRLGDDKRRRLNAELRPAGGSGGLKERSGSPPENRDWEEGP